jgi:leucyl aminopeptidase
MLSNSTRASVAVAPTFPKAVSATFVLVASDAAGPLGDTTRVPEDLRAAADALVKLSTGKAGELVTTIVARPAGPHRLYCLGLGGLNAVNAESLRKAGGGIYRTASKASLHDIALLVPKLPTLDESAASSHLTTGILLASFTYTEYLGSRRSKDLKDLVGVRIHLLTPASSSPAVASATTIALSTNFARTIASRPGNDINPPALAKVAAELARDTGLKLTVLDEKKMAKLGMGGILGVGSGSPTPPRMIVLEHKPAKARNAGKPYLLVGKSITFDTGGISIKPAEKMGKMIYDKCGGMAVLGAMHALAKLKTPVHVVGILTSAENHVSGSAYRPGDILKMHNGVTVEITNTDAEGRLVLGDALSWGIATYKPAAVVDLATLTGGCVVALGTTMAGLFANNDALAADLTAAGSGEGEKMWRLPVGDDQRDMLKSDLADVVNSAGRWASPLTGAAFVSLFVPPDGSVPWAHLDIAGVADSEKDLPYLGKGATGFGVRTLVTWLNSKT